MTARCPVPVDRIFIAASATDARLTRICVASVRRVYPDVRLTLLPGGPLKVDLVRELRTHWNVDVADLPAGDYGWGYVKLEPLFGPAGERFLVLDSDTVMTGPLFDIAGLHEAPFVVDDEAQSESETRRLYYDWQTLRRFDSGASAPQFVFNSGQWIGTAGILKREDFAPWVEWSMPRRLRHPNGFMPGDQGVLNYVLNKKVAEGLRVDRVKIMRWPGLGLSGFDAHAVAAGAAPPMIIHWAGVKRLRHEAMVGGDVLRYFEQLYYARLAGGSLRRRAAVIRHFAYEWGRKLLAKSRRIVGPQRFPKLGNRDPTSAPLEP